MQINCYLNYCQYIEKVYRKQVKVIAHQRTKVYDAAHSMKQILEKRLLDDIGGIREMVKNMR